MLLALSFRFSLADECIYRASGVSVEKSLISSFLLPAWHVGRKLPVTELSVPPAL